MWSPAQGERESQLARRRQSLAAQIVRPASRAVLTDADSPCMCVIKMRETLLNGNLHRGSMKRCCVPSPTSNTQL